MADQAPGAINPNPNLSGQAAAMAGASAAIFTATDRKVIQERGGEIEPNRPFFEVFKEGDMAAKVESQEVGVEPHREPLEIKAQQRQHQRMLKHAPQTAARDKIEITNRLPDTFEEGGQARPAAPPAAENAEATLKEETAELAKELKLNPTELFNRLAIEQRQLYSLVLRIKELHLQRLLAEGEHEFQNITERIKQESLAFSNKEAHPWLIAQLDQLTLAAAEYKLSLLQSLQQMDFDQERRQNMSWLTKVIEYYASK